MKLQTIDMVHGPLWGKILLFSLPLMASNLLQLLFNAVDVVVVGRFAGHASLAAVGSTASVIHLFLNLLIGLSVGVNVVIARFLGETGRAEEISRTLHTAIFVALLGGALLGGIGILAAPWVLELISSPADVRPLALLYIRVYFAGTPFVMLYNYGAAALRATGDTRRPLLYLSVSGVLNAVMNLFFVIVLRMDVAGVAAATIASQAVSAFLILRCLSHASGEVYFSWRRLCLDRNRLAAMARIGIPAGIQSCLFSLSNVAIQGAINTYDSVVIAGCSAGESVENFLYVSMNSFHHACQTFTSQNLGAGEHGRIQRIVRTCLTYTVVLGTVQSAVVVCFSRTLIGIYNTDPAVIGAGSQRLWMVATFYVIFGIADVLVGAIRGCGVPIAPVVINLLGTCVFRLVWVGMLDTGAVGVELVYLSYPVSWAIIMVALSLFWACLRRTRFPASNEACERSQHARDKRRD